MPYLVGASFITPLILRNGYFFPFIVPKILFIRTLILILLGCYLLLLRADFHRFRPRFSWVTVSIMVFYLSFAISTFVGVDWYRSFWDNHERMLGLFTITHYVLLYFIAAATLRTERDWSIVFRSALLLGSWVMLIGFWQRFVNPMALLNQGSTRVSATLGNAIYYSGYGLFLLFLSALQYVRETRSLWWRRVSIATGIIGFFGILLGGTRGTLLGLIAGAGVVMLGYAFLSREKTRAVKISKYVTVGGILLLAVLFMFRHTPVVSNIPGIGRLLTTSIVGGTVGTRFMAWDIAVEAWKERPVFGWGPNNYYYAFNEYYNPKFLDYGWGETWFDNAHSVIFNTLTVQGALGILSYLAIYIVAIIWLIRGIRAREIGEHVGFLSIGFLVAHFIGLATVFENPTSYLYFFVFLAFVIALISGGDKKVVTDGEKRATKHIPVALIASVGFVIFLIVFVTNINPARANKATVSSIQQIYARAGGGELFDLPLSYGSPHIDDIRNDVARSVIEMTSQKIEEDGVADLQSLVDRSIAELQKNRLLHPLDIRVNYTLYILFDFAYRATEDPQFLLEAEKEIRAGLGLSPKRQQFEYALVQNLAYQKRYDEARAVLETSIANNEQVSEGWFRLMILELQQNNLERTQEIFDEASDKKVVFPENNLQILTQAGVVVN